MIFDNKMKYLINFFKVHEKIKHLKWSGKLHFFFHLFSDDFVNVFLSSMI